MPKPIVLCHTGDGFVVIIDGARFLPCNVTISRVVAAVFNNKGAMLSDTFDGVALPESDALSPRYRAQAILGMGAERFDDSTATVVFQVRMAGAFYSHLTKVINGIKTIQSWLTHTLQDWCGLLHPLSAPCCSQ